MSMQGLLVRIWTCFITVNVFWISWSLGARSWELWWNKTSRTLNSFFVNDANQKTVDSLMFQNYFLHHVHCLCLHLPPPPAWPSKSLCRKLLPRCNLPAKVCKGPWIRTRWMGCFFRIILHWNVTTYNPFRFECFQGTKPFVGRWIRYHLPPAKWMIQSRPMMRLQSQRSHPKGSDCW